MGAHLVSAPHSDNKSPPLAQKTRGASLTPYFRLRAEWREFSSFSKYARLLGCASFEEAVGSDAGLGDTLTYLRPDAQ